MQYHEVLLEAIQRVFGERSKQLRFAVIHCGSCVLIRDKQQQHLDCGKKWRKVMSESTVQTRMEVYVGLIPCPMCERVARAAWTANRPAWVEITCDGCPRVFQKLKDLQQAGIVPHEISVAVSSYYKTRRSS